MFSAHINPSLGMTMGLTSGVDLNNQALQLERQGDLEGAERVHLQAIQVKEADLGTDHCGLIQWSRGTLPQDGPSRQGREIP